MGYMEDVCRIEGRCIKCKRRVVKRSGFTDDLAEATYRFSQGDDYLCQSCGGKDMRLPQRSLWSVITGWFKA